MKAVRLAYLTFFYGLATQRDGLLLTQAFRVPAIALAPRRQQAAVDPVNRHRGGQILWQFQEDDEKDESKEQTVDPAALQQEFNVMMSRGAGSGDKDDGEEYNDDGLYNAAPLFTGVVVTVFSLILTGYGIYAGLTGDDPLTGHANL